MTKIKLREYNPKKPTEAVRDAILELLPKYKIPLTVRQIHYKLVEIPEAKLPNTKNGYKKVSRILTDMRYGGLIDWDKIVDDTRSIYKTKSYKTIRKAINSLLEVYRRNRWKDNDYWVEVWVEKRTLLRQFLEITDKYDVYLYPCGGIDSTTMIYEAVKRLYPKVEEKKKLIILYFGDLDPTGDFMDEDIEKRLLQWGIPIKDNIKRICLNYKQIDEYNLQKKFDVKVKKGKKIYNKIRADPRARRMYEKYGEIFQAELEALDPNILNEMLENVILEYVDKDQQKKVKQTEKKEIRKIRKKLNFSEEET